MHQCLRLLLILLLGGARQLRRGNRGERPIWNRDDDGDIGSDGENPCVVQPHFSGDEERGECRTQCGRQRRDKDETRVPRVVLHQWEVRPQELPIGAERNLPERDEVAEVDEGGNAVVGADRHHKPIQRQHAKSVEQVACQHSEAHHHLAHHTGNHNAHKHIAVGLKNRLIKQEECQRKHHVVVVQEQRRFLAEPLPQRHAACPIEQGKHKKADQWYHHRPEEESVVGGTTEIMLFLPKIGKEANDRGRSPQLREADKECRSVHQHARKPNLLRGEEAGQHEESSEKAHRHPKIGGDGGFDTLSCNDTHYSIPSSSTSKIRVE